MVRSATPPDLSCTTSAPLPLPPSPGLRPFPWYDMYEKYLNLSMAGASTIQSNDVRSILRSLIVPFDNYEAQCRSIEVRGRKSCQPVRKHYQEWGSPITLLRLILYSRPSIRRVRAYRTDCKARQFRHPQELLRFIISNHLDGLENRCVSLSSVDAEGQQFVLWAVIKASTFHRVSGLRDEAVSLMETIIPLVEQDLDLKDSEMWWYYTILLIELAYCYAEGGHYIQARDILENKVKFPSKLRGSSHLEEIVSLRRRLLRKSREDALQWFGELENGRGGTCFKRKSHARLQEGSSQPEASEWGPFLTDCVEWDKI